MGKKRRKRKEKGRNYKDSVFRMWFNDEEKLKSLYSAATGLPCGEIRSIEVRTLQDSIFGNIKNDIAFVVNGQLFVFKEHMSTMNPNMPFRMLEYATESLNILLDHQKLHSSVLQKFPAPEFYVLYNGVRPLKEEDRFLCLSDAFLGNPDEGCSMELKVRVIDINICSGEEIVEKCPYLKDYATFVAKVRLGRAKGLDVDDAIEEAISYCKENEIMVEFFQEYGRRVRTMLCRELSDEEYINIRIQGDVELRLQELKEQLTGELTEQLTGELTEQITEQLTEELTGKVTAEVTKKVTEQELGILIAGMKKHGMTAGLARELILEGHEEYGEDEIASLMDKYWKD